MESLNITTLTGLDITLPHWQDGDIFILSRSEGIDALYHSVNDTILNRMDSSNSFYRYSLRVLNLPEAACNAHSYNIICPISNPITGLPEYIVASIPLPLLSGLIQAVVQKAEDTLKAYYREALLYEAASNPALFEEAVQYVIVEPHQKYESDIECDTKVEEDCCCIPGAAPTPAPRDYLKELSARERQRIFSEIPEKASNKALSAHPEAEKMLESTLANMTPEESIAILQYLIRRHKAVGRTAVGLLIDGSSRYELHVSEKGLTTTREYRNKAHYNMYLKEAKGEIVPITFKHTASYCIYMMHVIDRYVKKGNAKAIDLHQYKREFCETYATLFDEEPENILAKYETLFSRKIGKGSASKERSGRYKDYIKDIHTTFEKALGFEESMPFKIGENRFLPLIPDNITLPKKLSQLKIS